MSKNISEHTIKEFLNSVTDVEGEISLNGFIDRVSQAFNLSEYDEQSSSTRPSEPMYEQRVRNLISHDNLPNGVEYKDGKFFKN